MTKSKEDKVTEDAVKDINCFIIMPISNQQGYEPGHFSLVYEDIIKPAVIAAGMKPIRADETRNTNLIQLDILRKVIESDIAICDMSAKNPNVFYELGVRQAFDKPTVLMIDDDTTAPFDVSSLRYVDYKKGMGFRDVKKAVEDLTQTLRETYEKKDDKSEINSLIRLMDLTTPAQLNQVDISAEDRTAIQISELTSSMHNMQAIQSKILDSLNQTNRIGPETMLAINNAKRLIAESQNTKKWSEFVNETKYTPPSGPNGPSGPRP
jgi:23S rRNA U2552 (ribose-2'-O)-methylase RlmE/FtsJ